jgi:tRNA-dihydrouridine synthase B
MHRTESIRRYLQRSPLLPAPMCGYTDRPFRDLLRVMGAHLVCTEMYSSEAMARADPKTWRLMDYPGEEPPVSVQIFGTRPDLMAESARIAVRLGAAVVDLNMGCPAKKIVRVGCGAALAENLPLARRICQAVRAAVEVPVTLKTRWQENGQALEIARMCEGEGLDAIALHARTRAQAYSGTANWAWIARFKETVSIPVIGNGDVWTAADAARMRAETGCDAVMAGRGLVGNPWLVRDVAQQMETGVAPEPPSDQERLGVLFAHARFMHLHRGEKGLIEFRKHCVGYLKGMEGARAARVELMQVTALDQLREILERHFGAFHVLHEE